MSRDSPAGPVASVHRPPLLRASDMPNVAGLAVPSQFYTVTDKRVRIAGMSYPSPATPWAEIWRLEFRHVICLTDTRPHYSPSPLHMAHAARLEDLVSGDSPLEPVKEERLIRDAVAVAGDKISRHEGIVIHCAGGTGRTGTVIGCLLRALGYAGDEVVAYLDELNRARGRHGWPEAAWQGDLVRRF